VAEQQTTDDLPEQVRVRREKYDRLIAAGNQPYPVAVPRTHSLAEIRAAHSDLPPDTPTGQRVGVTGRVIFIRNTGKLCFAVLREGADELQLMLSAALGDASRRGMAKKSKIGPTITDVHPLIPLRIIMSSYIRYREVRPVLHRQLGRISPRPVRQFNQLHNPNQLHNLNQRLIHEKE